MPRATSLAAVLLEKNDVKAELIEGAGGIFDIAVDGKIVYSKLETGEFPSDDHVVELLQGRTA